MLPSTGKMHNRHSNTSKYYHIYFLTFYLNWYAVENHTVKKKKIEQKAYLIRIKNYNETE